MAVSYRGLTIKFGGDTSDLQDALKKIQKSSKDTQADLKAIEKALKFNPGNTDLLEQKVRKLNAAYDETKDRLDAYKQALQKLEEKKQRGEQLTLLSVVNTLCALDEVDEVEFYIEGRKPGLYTYLSLAGPFRADLGVVGPIRSELNEFEAVLYLPDADQTLLHSLPLRVRAGSGLSREEALLRALWDRPTHNGMMNPVETALPPRSVNVEGGVCTIDFPDRSFLGQDASTELSAVRTITATMCSLDTVDRVRFTVNGQDAALTYNDLSFPLAANRLWMLR